MSTLSNRSPQHITAVTNYEHFINGFVLFFLNPENETEKMVCQSMRGLKYSDLT